MSKTEILEELPKLTADERNEIRLKIAELDGDDWLDADDPLTDEEKALLEARLAEIEQHPKKSIPWEEAKKHLGRQHTAVAAWLTPVLQGVTIGMLIVFAVWVWHAQ